MKTINEKFGDTDSTGKKWEDYDTILCPDGQVIDMQQILHDQETAKAALVHIQPFFRGFINNLRPIYTFMIKTQATDGYNYFINPQFTAGLSLTEKTFVMAHEIMHCVLNHLRRGRSHDPNKSNIAADYECNITLSDTMGLFKFDTIKNMGAYIDKKYEGWGYEKIYDEVNASSSNNMNNKNQQNQAQQNQQNGNNGGKGGSGSGSGKNSGGDNNQSNQAKSADYKAGWKKAIEDYKAGKLKL